MSAIEHTAHAVTIVDENTAIRLAVPDPAFEKNIIIIIINIPSGSPQTTKISAVHN
jgi:hypothetical protein